MNIKKLFAIFSAIIIAMACQAPDVDDAIYHYDAYINQSSHTITLSLYNETEQKISKITLKPGEASQHLYRGTYSKKVCSIDFDLTVVLDYQKLPEDLQGSKYNILYNSSGNYVQSIIGSHSFLDTYTFTDADYEFALENGTMIKY